MSVSSSSWGLGRAEVCDCGTPWTFLLPFLDGNVLESILGYPFAITFIDRQFVKSPEYLWRVRLPIGFIIENIDAELSAIRKELDEDDIQIHFHDINKKNLITYVLNKKK